MGIAFYCFTHTTRSMNHNYRTSTVRPLFTINTQKTHPVHTKKKTVPNSAPATPIIMHTPRQASSSAGKGQETIILREDCRKHFNLFRQRRDFVVPVEPHACHTNHSHQVHGGVRLAEAVVRPSAKDEPVLRLLFCSTRDPSIRLE